MPRRYLLAIPILTASMLAWSAVAQNTPGDIPDPGSYQGSMEMQRREQESAAQIQQQNSSGSTRITPPMRHRAGVGVAAASRRA